MIGAKPKTKVKSNNRRKGMKLITMWVDTDDIEDIIDIRKEMNDDIHFDEIYRENLGRIFLDALHKKDVKV